MSGENAFEYIDFYDFSQSDDEPEFLRSELQDDHTLKMDSSSTEISELVLPSGAVIGTLLFIFSPSKGSKGGVSSIFRQSTTEQIFQTKGKFCCGCIKEK